MKSLGNLLNERQRESILKSWSKFSDNILSKAGLTAVAIVIFLAVTSPWLAPYPESWARWVDYSQASKPPSISHLFGTDIYGRDILSRIMYAFRFDLIMVIGCLSIDVIPGTILGLLAGYYRGSPLDNVIMRITDIFLAIPTIVLALAVASLLEPNMFNTMMAVASLWWPWYSRLAYSLTTSIRNEYFVQAAELIGASPFHIMFREILPNMLSPIFTKLSLDVGWVILISSTMSYVGLGVQEPLPALGNMVASGSRYMPDYWWMVVFPALAIAFLIMGFNLLGDGIRDMLSVEEI
jgi:peptide/nickel transport system permease protein